MLQKALLSSFILTSFFLAAEDTSSSCGGSPLPMRVAARHIEANGIGYDQGYTTLEGFFAPSNLLKDAWVPFVDLRAHMFNDGKFAANGGFGLRYLANSRIWGGSAYYDYRDASVQHYNQVSLGLETLGEIWDFRINGYLPIGDKESSFFDVTSAGFACHSLMLSSKREVAMKGANAEVGFHVDKWQTIPLYFAAGPYYLEGKGNVAWGGELRAAIDIFDYVRLEGNASYDNIFKWIGQGQLSFVMPFGKKRQVKQGKQKSCKTALALSKRALQRVDRSEIIPIDIEDVKIAAVNPVTCRPYHCWFVDNTSCGLVGTFESPFNTLIAAQNISHPGDIIYVFPGDGTSKGMDQGIILQDYQKLLGAGIAHTLSTTFGCVTICSQAVDYPLVDDLNYVNYVYPREGCVELANSCEVAGMHITSTRIGLGISGGVPDPSFRYVGITNANIHENIIKNITGVSLSGRGGISFYNCIGELIVKSNDISVENNKAGVYVFNLNSINTVNSSILIEGNKISLNNASAMFLGHSNPGRVDFCVHNNEMTNFGSGASSGLLVDCIGGVMCGTIASNKIIDTGFSVFIIIDNGSRCNFDLTDNVAIGTAPPPPLSFGGFTIISTNSGRGCVRLENNREDQGFFLGEVGGLYQLESPDNTLAGVQGMNFGFVTAVGTVNFVPPGTCACNTPCAPVDDQGCCAPASGGGLPDMTIFTPSGIDFSNKIFKSIHGE